MRGKRGWWWWWWGGGERGETGATPFPFLRLPGAWSHSTRFSVDRIKAMSCGINLSTYNSHLPTMGPFTWHKMAMLESKSRTGTRQTKENTIFKVTYVFVFVMSQCDFWSLAWQF